MDMKRDLVPVSRRILKAKGVALHAEPVRLRGGKRPKADDPGEADAY